MFSNITGFMRWRSLLTCLALGATLGTADTPAQNEQRERTFIAALRPDSLLVPIAIYDDREWWNPWPISYEGDERVRSLAVPRTLAEVPAEWLPPGTRFPERWRLQRPSGRLVDIRALTPARPTGFSITEFIGVRTDYPAQRDSSQDEVGIAISGPGELGRFAALTPNELRSIQKQLTPRVRDLAGDALAKWRAEHSSDGPIELTLAGKAVELQLGLVRAINPFRGRVYYDLDAETRYRAKSKDPALCEVRVSVSGIVVAESGLVISDHLIAGASESDCASGFGFGEHLATLQLGDRVVWVMKYVVEDGFGYFLKDPETDREIPLRGTVGSR